MGLLQPVCRSPSPKRQNLGPKYIEDVKEFFDSEYSRVNQVTGSWSRPKARALPPPCPLVCPVQGADDAKKRWLDWEAARECLQYVDAVLRGHKADTAWRLAPFVVNMLAVWKNLLNLALDIAAGRKELSQLTLWELRTMLTQLHRNYSMRRLHFTHPLVMTRVCQLRRHQLASRYGDIAKVVCKLMHIDVGRDAPECDPSYFTNIKMWDATWKRLHKEVRGKPLDPEEEKKNTDQDDIDRITWQSNYTVMGLEVVEQTIDEIRPRESWREAPAEPLPTLITMAICLEPVLELVMNQQWYLLRDWLDRDGRDLPFYFDHTSSKECIPALWQIIEAVRRVKSGTARPLGAEERAKSRVESFRSALDKLEPNSEKAKSLKERFLQSEREIIADLAVCKYHNALRIVGGNPFQYMRMRKEADNEVVGDLLGEFWKSGMLKAWTMYRVPRGFTPGRFPKSLRTTAAWMLLLDDERGRLT
ncbi:hypothetical protein V8F33_004832 [Rhypophila sp. PSN 637]